MSDIIDEVAAEIVAEARWQQQGPNMRRFRESFIREEIHNDTLEQDASDRVDAADWKVQTDTISIAQLYGKLTVRAAVASATRERRIHLCE